MRRATWTHVTLWVGLAGVAAGILLNLLTPPSTFGFASFAPGADYAFVAGSLPWQATVGPVLVLVGAVVAGFALGRLSVRRRS
jgi:hypothetical protein